MASPSRPAIASVRNRHNVLCRHHGCDDPRTREAAAELRAAKIADLIESAPPLTTEQVDRLRRLLPASPHVQSTDADVARLDQLAAAIDQREAREAVATDGT